MVSIDILKTEMTYNKQFATYVSSYAETHDCSVEDAFSSESVQSAYRNYSEV